MRATPPLRELQAAFVAALYDDALAGPLQSIAGNGLTPAARLRIYRRSCNEIQTAALRTSYPAVLALAGRDWFDQAARRYRGRYPSRSGNLQAFGACFANYLETIPASRTLPYLADVARLEWLRQETILSADSQAISFDEFVACLDGAKGPLHAGLSACVHLLRSRHRVLTIWRFALDPRGDLALDGDGEAVMIWREGGEVVMTAVDAGTYAYVSALEAGGTLDEAGAGAAALDGGFDPARCMSDLIGHHLITRTSPCRETEGGPWS